MATALARKPLTVAQLEAAIASAWTRETSADPQSWTAENPAWGQCAVTALVVQDYFGGEIRRGEVGSTSHYWNILPDGCEADLTRHQFPAGAEVVKVEGRTRDYVLSHPDTVRRYRRLARSVRRSLGATDAAR
jgi:hypothetical protein